MPGPNPTIVQSLVDIADVAPAPVREMLASNTAAAGMENAAGRVTLA